MRKGQFIREVKEIDTLGRKCRNMNVETCQKRGTFTSNLQTYQKNDTLMRKPLTTKHREMYEEKHENLQENNCHIYKN